MFMEKGRQHLNKTRHGEIVKSFKRLYADVELNQDSCACFFHVNRRDSHITAIR